MSTLFKIIPFIGLLLIITGGIGLFMTHINLAVGSLGWVQGNLTYGTFTIIGLAITICLMISGPEIE